jgi:indoleamine 2,3-dioxygenase
LWDEIGADLPKLLAAGRAGRVLFDLAVLDPGDLVDGELRRAMLLLSFFGHAYVWETWRDAPRQHLPAGVAVPWWVVARKLGRPPVLSYASYALDNWRLLEPRDPIELGNVALLQNFLGGVDEEWFVAVHVAIEAEAATLVEAVPVAQAAASVGDAELLEVELERVAGTLERIVAILDRMPENCDPYVYYHRVRPYIHGFMSHPVVYEGVDELGGVPQRYFGETGAQSTIVPLLDAALGVQHASDDLTIYLARMRDYMPPEHRAFLESVENGPSIRDFVVAGGGGPLSAVHQECIQRLAAFRTRHLEYAATYIHRQAEHGANSVSYGTGGTPFMAYLKKHRDETHTGDAPA